VADIKLDILPIDATMVAMAKVVYKLNMSKTPRTATLAGTCGAFFMPRTGHLKGFCVSTPKTQRHNADAVSDGQIYTQQP